MAKRKTAVQYDAKLHPSCALMLCSKAGVTNSELAEALGVVEQTIYGWINSHEEFAAALKEGKEIFDCGKVENALLKSALGYDTVDTTYETVVDLSTGETLKETSGPRKGENKLIAVKEVHKHTGPNGNDCMRWLTNRKADSWKQKIEAQAVNILPMVSIVPYVPSETDGPKPS